MTTARLEAFSDGVMAVIITIMVLELKAPHGSEWEALLPLMPNVLVYTLSFVFLGIYWVNHHHMLHTIERVSGGILWANLHLLFWLSLTPFATAWMGEHHDEPVPTAVYGIVLFAAGVAYYILQMTIIRKQGPHSRLAAMIGRDYKGRASPVIYLVGIGVAFVSPWIAEAIYVAVALTWLVPDRRIERHIA
jgi:uncharacterized membrane protein